MPPELKGFWSYVRRDDDAVDGAITRLAKHVEQDYELKRGDDSLDMFLDTAKVKWGERWREKVREAIKTGAFFIPLVTPRFLKSDECRSEILEFAMQEKQLGRQGLIMPLYLVEVKEIEDKNISDPVVELLLDSHREDWRERRLLDRSVQAYRKGVDKLVNRLIEIAEIGVKEPATLPTAGDEEDESEEDGDPGGIRSRGPRGNGPTSIGGAESIDLADAGGDIESSEEQWMLEQLAEGEDAFPRIVETLSEIAKTIGTVGELTTAAVPEMEQTIQDGGAFKQRLVIANRLAQQLDGPAETLKELTSQYTADLALLDPAIKKIIELAGEQQAGAPEEVEEFFTAIGGMIDSSQGAAEQIAGMIQAMEFPAKSSRELNRPISSMRGSLQSVLDANEVIGGWRSLIEIARATEGH